MTASTRVLKTELRKFPILSGLFACVILLGSHSFAADVVKTTTAKAKKQTKASAVKTTEVAENDLQEVLTNTATPETAAKAEATAAKIEESAVPTANAHTTVVVPNPSRRFNPSVKFVTETTSTLSKDDPTSYAGSYDLTLAVTDQKSNITVSTRNIYSREYSYEKDDGTSGGFENPGLTVGKKWYGGTDFESPLFDSISTSVGSSFGTTKEANRRSFIASVGPSVGVRKAFGKFTVGQSIGYTRGFYRYDIRSDGTVNSPNNFRSVTDASYSLTEKLSLTAWLDYKYAISFQEVGKALTLTSFSVDYSFTKVIGASLGVATEKGTLEADGMTNRIHFFDSSVAQAFLDIVLVF